MDNDQLPPAVPPTPPEQQQQAQPTQDYDQPVAYGANGEPLYARPGTVPVQPGPQFVHLSRAVDPAKPELTPEHQQKHEQSLKAFPLLNISSEEYVITSVTRHVIGVVAPIAVTLILVVIIVAFIADYPLILKAVNNPALPSMGLVALVGGLLALLILIAGYISFWVYKANKFYLTNESIIQEIQTGLFNHDEQTISLGNIEDASFKQVGAGQILFNYGTIRLSTEGDETTYQMTYVTNPKRQIMILNNAVEAFKNGRPVEDSSDNL